VPGKYILVGEGGAGAKALNYLMHKFLRVDDSLSRINAETDAHYAKIADDMAAASPVGKQWCCVSALDIMVLLFLNRI
jgi:hypothetical protein